MKGIHKGDLGMQRARIAPMLTGEELAELFALADFTLSAGGSLRWGRPASAIEIRLKALRLTEWVRRPDISRGTHMIRLTKLGWLTLLTRCEREMRHLLPLDEAEDAA